MELLHGFVSQYPQFKDYFLSILFAAAFFVLRLFLDILIFENLAVWLIGTFGSSQALKNLNGEKITKMKESLWKLTCYTVLEIWAYIIISDKPWFNDTDAFFNGWPHQTLPLPLKLYYMVQCGFYIYSIAALLVWETRRKDFAVMLTHHFVTLALITYSYMLRFFRIGSMVLALHDMTDLIMELAKLCKYCGKELSASMCFALFSLSWFSLRLVYFPFWIIWSSTYESVKYLNHSSSYHTWIYYSFNTMLMTLLVFHIYWWTLICRMAKRQLRNRGTVGEDIRSDSENEE